MSVFSDDLRPLSKGSLTPQRGLVPQVEKHRALGFIPPPRKQRRTAPTRESYLYFRTLTLAVSVGHDFEKENKQSGRQRDPPGDKKQDGTVPCVLHNGKKKRK